MCWRPVRGSYVIAISRGKGFTGAMKRHNFKGQWREATAPQ